MVINWTAIVKTTNKCEELFVGKKKCFKVSKRHHIITITLILKFHLVKRK